MPDPIAAFAELRRPRLLLASARIGAPDYCRDRDLNRALQGESPAPGRATLACLLETEAELEDLRLQRTGNYSPARHVAVMIALVAEIRAMQDSAPGPA